MSIRPRILLALILALCVAMLAVQAARLGRADRHTEESQARLIDLERDTAELERLRNARVTALASEPPSDDLLTRVRGVMNTAGLSDGLFQGLRRVGERESRNGTRVYITRSERLSLDPLTPREIGAFLDGWTVTQPEWTVDAVTMNHSRRQTGSYAVTITLSAKYAGARRDTP